MRTRKLLSPHEAEVDRLLQIMAVLIDRLGGEVILSRQDIEAFFDIPVISRVISPDYVRFRVSYPDDETVETHDINLPDTPEENPQT